MESRKKTNIPPLPPGEGRGEGNWISRGLPTLVCNPHLRDGSVRLRNTFSLTPGPSPGGRGEASGCISLSSFDGRSLGTFQTRSERSITCVDHPLPKGEGRVRVLHGRSNRAANATTFKNAVSCFRNLHPHPQTPLPKGEGRRLTASFGRHDSWGFFRGWGEGSASQVERSCERGHLQGCCGWLREDTSPSPRTPLPKGEGQPTRPLVLNTFSDPESRKPI